jgi:dTDP-4-dehydrorhamnose reductase
VYPDCKGPHAEGNENPVNIYGRSKLAGETAALSHSGALVLRTNIFGPSRTPGRASLSDFVIGSLSQGKSIQLFEDIYFSPLHMETVCALMVGALEKGLVGVYNMGSREGMSKKDFSLKVALHKELPTDRTKTVKSSHIQGRAPRPKDMRLDVSRIEKALGREMPTLEDEIRNL